MKKAIGITVCVAGAIVLAWLSIGATDYYWAYLVAAGLLGVAAGTIKNWPTPPR